jgi:hypothetical protein
VLANAPAHHPEVERAFKESIYWISLGQTPHIEELQRWLARQLGDEGLLAGPRRASTRRADTVAPFARKRARSSRSGCGWPS